MGIRLSPHEGVGPNDVRDNDPEAPFTHVLQQLGQQYSRRLAYVHLIETTRSWRVDHHDYDATYDLREQVAAAAYAPNSHKNAYAHIDIYLYPSSTYSHIDAHAFKRLSSPPAKCSFR